MKILVPMAAGDQFFDKEDYHFPKPLVEVAGQPMIKLVIDNLRAAAPDAEFIFVVNEQDCQHHSLDKVLDLMTDGQCKIVKLRQPTQGAVCSCLMAIEHIVGDEPLLISNCDQILSTDLAEALAEFRRMSADAAVIAFDSVHPRWSYIRTEGNSVIEAAEKSVISRFAIAGIYYYARGRDFLDAGMQLIHNGVTEKGSYFISLTLNELILRGKNVTFREIPSGQYHSFYSPHKIAEYERLVQQQVSLAPPTVVSHPRMQELTVVIPMAGEGSRFTNAGFVQPKPFIDVAGETMIERVLDNLYLRNARYVVIALQEHLEACSDAVIRLLKRPNVTIVPLDGPTDGTATTVLLARHEIRSEAPLLVANCDQLVDFDLQAFVDDCLDRDLDGSILVFKDPYRDSKWSFARVNADRIVTEVKEKVAISDFATVGLYLFRRGQQFVDWAIDMIAHNDRTNNEFYVCPVYNHGIASGARIGAFEISVADMTGLGTPEDLHDYLSRQPVVSIHDRYHASGWS